MKDDAVVKLFGFWNRREPMLMAVRGSSITGFETIEISYNF